MKLSGQAKKALPANPRAPHKTAKTAACREVVLTLTGTFILSSFLKSHKIFFRFYRWINLTFRRSGSISPSLLRSAPEESERPFPRPFPNIQCLPECHAPFASALEPNSFCCSLFPKLSPPPLYYPMDMVARQPVMFSCHM